MAFHILLTSSPVLAFSGNSVTSSPMEDVLPREIVPCEKLADAVAAYDSYAARVKETGKPAALCALKPRSCPARKPPGFDKTFRGARYVNLDKAPASAW